VSAGGRNLKPHTMCHDADAAGRVVKPRGQLTPVVRGIRYEMLF